MARFSDILTDSNQVPIPGVLVTVRDLAGNLATITNDDGSSLKNPFVAGTLGQVVYNATDEIYLNEYRYGGRLLREDEVIVGSPPEFAGAPGPASNTRLLLADLKAAPITDKTSIYDRALWTWETSNAPYSADDINVVKANSTALTIGAWIRQSIDGLTYQQVGTGTVLHPLPASVRQIGIVPADFGIVGDQSDETAKLQAAINAASANRVPLLLHGAPVIGITAPIDLKGRYVDIRGSGIKNTIIAAKSAMATMIDAEETSDMIIAPFTLRGLRLAGGSLAQYGIRTRYRHYGLLEDVYIDATTTTGLWEKDAWNNRRIGVTIQNCPTGFHLVGSNHRTAWFSCAVAGASGSHWIVGSQGTAADGNYAVLLKNCDIEFGAGKGLVVEQSVTLALEDCYIGEGIAGVVIENRGFVSARGGALFVGSTVNSTVRPLGGLLTVEGAAVNGQGNETLASLGKLLPTEIAASGVGAVTYRNCLGNIASTPIGVDGEPFGAVPGRAYANRSGRTFTKATFGGADATLTYDGDTIIVTVSNAGTSGKISISTPLNDDWSRNGPVFFMPSYQSTMGVTAKLSNGPLGSGYILIALGANTNIAQVPVLNSVPSALPYTVLEFVIDTPVVGGVFRLTRVSFSDAMFQNKRGGTFGTIGMVA